MEINEFKEWFLSLSEVEKEKVLNIISNNVPAYDLIYKAKSKMDRVDEGDELPLRELIKIGFNNINLKTENESFYGYSESDFDEDMLDKRVIITSFYHDCDDYLCVECVMEEETVKKENEEFVKILEDNGFNVKLYKTSAEVYYEISQYTPLGEDWNEIIWPEKGKSIFETFVEFVGEFDVDEAVEPFISIRGKNGVPSSLEALLDDAKWKQETLNKVAQHIVKIYNI